MNALWGSANHPNLPRPISSHCKWLFINQDILLHSTVMQSKSRTQNFSEFVCLINVLCLRSRLLISGIILLPHHLSRSLLSGIKQQASLIVKIFTVIRFLFFVYFWRFWLFAQLWHAFSSFRSRLGGGNGIEWKWTKIK